MIIVQGTHPSLKSSTNAKATVAAIIDGTGSLGGAVGPLIVGVIANFLVGPKQKDNNSLYKCQGRSLQGYISNVCMDILMLHPTSFVELVRKFRAAEAATVIALALFQ